MRAGISKGEKYILAPALWLIILIAGLAQLSDAFTSSLPDEVADDLRVPLVFIEYTLTAYLLGFAIGILFWGKLSDHFGRKPCVLSGLILFIVGCAGCCFAHTIEVMMVSRFAQALGSSVGIVLVQVICRDVFHDKMLSKAYASIETALAIVPSLGAFADSLIVEYYGWRAIFWILIVCAFVVIVLISLRLPETHPPYIGEDTSMLKTAFTLFRNKKVIGYGLIISACLGISFSYYAEGEFYVVHMLGLSSNAYNLSFIVMGLAYMAGSWLSKLLTKRHHSQKIMVNGIMIIVASNVLFCGLLVIHLSIYKFTSSMIVWTVFSSQIGIMFGSGLIVSNVLTLALVDYKKHLGAASSLFGFFYYALISLFTFGMGALHNGTLLPMPLYFLALSLLILIVQNTMIKSSRVCHQPG
jgi:DHA1 family bicyclomycin/chloramphenicol resistance-like MFS transporter